MERASFLRRLLHIWHRGLCLHPVLDLVGSLFFIDVLGYSPAKASWVILITTGICMLCQPPAGRGVDKVGSGIPMTVGLVMQAVALAWIGLFFGPDTTLTEMVIPLALMGIGVGISLPACNTAAMSAVDTERAGMGSGVMQMGFIIPAALGMALATSVIGAFTATKTAVGVDRHAELDRLATTYTQAVLDGNLSHANGILAALPDDSAEAIKRAAVSASSAAITTSMLVLAVIVLVGGIFAWLAVGRRPIPDRIETTHAAAAPQ